MVNQQENSTAVNAVSSNNTNTTNATVVRESSTIDWKSVSFTAQQTIDLLASKYMRTTFGFKLQWATFLSGM